jgi:hypothetical protein
MPNDAELIETARGPGRPRTVRDEEVAPRRRRSADATGLTNTLAVPENLLDRKKFEYRWIVDEGIRLHNLTVNDDYDIVSKDLSGKSKDDRSDAYRVQVGMKADGSGPLFQYLCRKPLSYAQDDRKQRQKANDEKQRARVKADEAAVLADNGKKIEDSAMKESQNAAHKASMKPSEGFR